MVSGPEETHESYGLLSVTRGHGKEQTFFGASILHGTDIMLEVQEAVKMRDLHRDWYHGRGKLIQIRMTTSQFADMITSIGMGGGTPVTLMYVRGDEKSRREDPPPPSAHTDFRREYQEDISSITEQLDDIIASTKGSVRKKAEALKRHIAANMPFLQRQLERKMETTVSEAKATVDDFILQRMHQIGLDAVQAQSLLALPEYESLAELDEGEEATN